MELILVGGFLGAGKTTAIAAAAARLKEQDVQPAVITNDQGSQLIDSQWMRSNGFPAGEVTGGCFCCNFDDLDKAIQNLIAAIKPGVILAESVGSCTDLIATVLKPMRRAHPEMQISLSVFADATILLAQWMGGQYVFKKNVHYIYDKQLEEADIIVLSKIDLLPPGLQTRIYELAETRFRDKMILVQNNLNPSDIDHWLETARNFQATHRDSLEIDYPEYGAGEAELAWLDARVAFEGVNAGKLAEDTLQIFHRNIRSMGWPIGHLKGLLTDEAGSRKISFTSSMIGILSPERPLQSQKVELMINARVQCEPSSLYDMLTALVEQANFGPVKARIVQEEHFSPGFPRPTHRIV